MSDIENAIRLALKVHSGQKDKAGAPYLASSEGYAFHGA